MIHTIVSDSEIDTRELIAKQCFRYWIWRAKNYKHGVLGALYFV